MNTMVNHADIGRRGGDALQIIMMHQSWKTCEKGQVNVAIDNSKKMIEQEFRIGRTVELLHFQLSWSNIYDVQMGLLPNSYVFPCVTIDQFYNFAMLRSLVATGSTI